MRLIAYSVIITYNDDILSGDLDNFFGYLMNERNMSREEAFLLIRQWADEFWFNHYNKSAFEIYKTGMSYYDFVDKFIEEKLASFKENK